jgi:hypothetical protein
MFNLTFTNRNGKTISFQDHLNSAYEQLIMLDEIAGELDPESNGKINDERMHLKQMILELEALKNDQTGV